MATKIINSDVPHPQLIPVLLPRFIKKKEALERFDDEDYINEIEESFKLRFVENLEVCVRFRDLEARIFSRGIWRIRRNFFSRRYKLVYLVVQMVCSDVL